MANFSLANQAEILLRLHDGLQPGLKVLAPTKYEIAYEESRKNQNCAENTNCENRHTAFLAVWSFGSAQFSTFWTVAAYKMMELKRDLSLAAYLSARKMYLERKRRYT